MYAEDHRQQDAALEAAGSYPSGQYRGRGLVICAGGPRLFTCAWVLLRVLRDILHTSLPIEIWHRGATEMDDCMRSLLRRHGAEVVDACQAGSCETPGHGWALKPFSILHSRFQEVIYLDADNIPTVDPAQLFDAAPYRETGALFWPDLHPIQAESPIWEICRVTYREEPSFESGQIVLDKARCWRPLSLAKHFNDRADFYYRHLYGDKDTFHMAWRFLGQPYGMPPLPPRLMVSVDSEPPFLYIPAQRNFDGRVIFQHRNTPKFILLGWNPRYPGFRFEDECFAYLGELARLWNGRVSTVELAVPAHAGSGTGSRWFRYVQLSHGEQTIELRADQRIGHGSSRWARTWRVIADGSRSALEIFGDECLICRLVRHEDGVWRGRWLRYERMPVELIPLS